MAENGAGGHGARGIKKAASNDEAAFFVTNVKRKNSMSLAGLAATYSPRA
jgi:hypothetical protein